MGSNDGTSGSGSRRGKVAILIDEYDLEGVGDRLERDWTRAEGERRSLRDLADDFNVELVKAVLDAADVTKLDGEVRNLYRLLSDDDAGTTGDRIQARRELERDGVDVDELTSNFVSYQAVRTYLTNHRDATYERPEADEIDQMQSTVDQLQQRLINVTEDRVERIDDLAVAEPTVIVDVRIFCEACGSQFTMGELSEATCCDCS